MWRQWQNTVTRGGMYVGFSDSTNTAWTTYDTDGELTNSDSITGSWRKRVFVLTPFVNKQITNLHVGADQNTQAGSWAIAFNDIVIVSTDGTVTPIYSNQTGWSLSCGGNNSGSFSNEHVANVGWAASTTTTYYHGDHLGSTRLLSGYNGYPISSSIFLPYGEEFNSQTTVNHYKFTGKERDSESGLDYFGARYHGSNLGRFMTPDPVGGDLSAPQSLNRYAYVANNPLRYTDPTGMYMCKDSEKCDSDADKAFEEARQAALKSKDSNVVRAASAYGDPTKDNGVSVKFGDPGKGHDGITSHDLGVGPDGELRAQETVTIREGLSGSGLVAAVGHEGSHVADAQEFVSTITMGGNFDVSKNLSKYQTEFKAYMVSNSLMNSQGDKASYGQGCDGDPCILGFGVGQKQAGKIINQLLANPANGYGVTPRSPGALLYPLLTVPTVPK